MSDSTENPVGSSAEENPQSTPASEQTAPVDRPAVPEQTAPVDRPTVPEQTAPVDRPALPEQQATTPATPTQPTTPLHQGQSLQSRPQPAQPTQPTTPLHQGQSLQSRPQPTQPTTPLNQAQPGQPPLPPYGQAQPQAYQRPAAPYQPTVPYGQQPYARADYGNGSFGTPGQPYAPQDPAFNSAAYAASGAHTAPQKPERKRRGGVALIAALAIGAVIGGASGAGISVWALSSNQGSTTDSASSPTSITVNDPQNTDWVTAVAQKASPSVVTISATAGSSGGTGSGVVLSADGYVVTNTHVVTLDGATADATLKVTADDGRLYDATVVGTDPTNDLAVIKLKDASGLTPIEFADSSKLNVGDDVVAIGAPLGLSGTVTNGIVSALNRSITVASSAAPNTPSEGDGGSGGSEGGDGSGSPFDFWNFDFPGQQTPDQQTPDQGSTGSTGATSTIALSVIQTDAAINPGNSGGALLDDEGKLIGINVAIASSGQSSSSSQAGNIGVGFSIPSETVKRVTDEIIKDGKATHGLLGAGVADATQAADATTTGALINSVTDGGAAQKAGLQVGDVVTAFDGVQVQDYIDLTALVRAQAAGATVQITYLRDGQSKTVDVTLGAFEG